MLEKMLNTESKTPKREIIGLNFSLLYLKLNLISFFAFPNIVTVVFTPILSSLLDFPPPPARSWFGKC